VCLTFDVCNFFTVLSYAEQFVVACLLDNGLKYGDKPGGFCQKSRECRSGEEQSHKSPTPGDGPDEYRRAVKSILIYLENTSGI